METKQYRQPRRRKKRRKVPRKRRTGLLIRLRQMSWYNLILVAIIVAGYGWNRYSAGKHKLA